MKELNTFLRNTIQNKDPYSAQHYYQLMTKIGQKSPKALQILKKQRKLLQRAGGCGASTPHAQKNNIQLMAPAYTHVDPLTTPPPYNTSHLQHLPPTAPLLQYLPYSTSHLQHPPPPHLNKKRRSY